ncbi:hypothetical protein JCGZ_23398 [Jatropha curcas]|uniref:Major facilitator superfamily (MFS) profile domain-containing protein n=1 Tax=Jatropha curcas TaxID=180498 RepID=A0A067JU96_JATCU|nr:hypothetical protein JCGZ_23398 [Jatropha curcas]
MAISADVEYHDGSLGEPFVVQKKETQHKHEHNEKSGAGVGGLGMVLLSTAIAVSGSFTFGCCVGYSAPTQLGIMNDLSLSYSEFCIVFGVMAIYLIGAFVKWRILALTGNVPCLVMLVGLCFIPESPRWLAMMGRKYEFEESLQKLRGAKADISPEKTDIQASLGQLEQLPKATLLDLFRRRNIRFVTVGVGLMFFQQFCGINGIIFYADRIFISAGVPPSAGSISYSGLQVILTAFLTTLIDRTGRRPLLMISACGLLLGNLLIGTSFFCKAHHLAIDLVPILAITGVMLYIASFSIGMGGIPWVLMSELFPLHLKGIAGSLVTLVNWFASWFISLTFNLLMEWNSYGTFFLYACICIYSIFFIAKLVPETKGRTLEEIQASAN